MWLRGLCATTAVFVGLVAVSAWLDWAIHLDDGVLRGLMLVTILVVTGWVLRRTLLQPLRTPPAADDVAMRLEERFPELRDGLASVVQFTGTRFGSAIGSPGLQRIAATRTESLLADLPIDEVIEPAPVRRMAWGAVVVCGAAAVLMGFNQSATWLALRRLVIPFAAPSWPRQVNLRVLSTEWQPLEASTDDIPRVALGEEYRVYIENQTGRLPSRVTLETKTEAGATPAREPLRVVSLRDGEGVLRDVAAVTLKATQPKIWFRALAGDDDKMAWFEIHAVPVPQLEAIRVRVVPPDYTGLEPRELPGGLGDIEAWIGSRIEFRGRSSRPLQTAAIRLKSGDPIPATIGEDGREFRVEWQANEVGVSTYAVELRDVEGFEPGRIPRFELRVKADAVPEVTMERPATDLQVTPTATVPVEFVARDDLGLTRSDAVWRKGDEVASEQPLIRIPLWRADQPVAESAPAGTPRAENATGKVVTGTWQWDLAPLRLQPGQVITLMLEAADGARPEHVGHSVARRLRIVSPEQKTQELAARQAELLEQIERAEKQQALAREQTRDLEIQANEAGGLRPQDLTTLERLEAAQRQIASQLSGQPGSLDQRLAEALDEFRANQLGDEAAVGRLEQMSREISRLSRESLPGIERSLTRARKEGERRADETANEPARSSQDGNPPESRPGDDRDSPTEPRPDVAGDAPSKGGTNPTKATDPRKTDPGKPESTEPNPAPDGGDTKPQPGKATEPDRSESGDNRPDPKHTGEPAGDPVVEPLRDALQQQADVGDSLKNLARQLARWRDERDATDQLNQLADDQKEVSEETEKLGQDLVGKSRTDLTPQERADLEKLVGRQRQLGDREEAVERQLETAAEKLAADDPEGAAALREQLEALRDAAVGERFREAAERLRENKTAAARTAQKSIEEALGRIARGETGSDSDQLEQLEQLVKEQRGLEERLESLMEREETLQKRMDEAKGIEDPAARAEELRKLEAEQDALRQELEQAARQLRRLARNAPAERLANAARKLEQQQKKLAQGELDAAAEDQQEVLDQLAEARQELAEERAADEEQLAFEQLARLRSKLEGLLVRQEAAVKEFERLRGLVPPGGSWTRPALASLRGLGSAEGLIADEAQALAPQVEAARVFSLALEQSAGQLRRLVELLGERDLGAETQGISTRVAERFRELIRLIAERQAGADGAAAGGQAGGGGQPGGGNDAPTEDAISLLAEFKLLRTLQQDVAERTEAVRAKETTDDVTQQLEKLAEEQSRLADLARDLMTKLKSVVENDDDSGDAEMDETGDEPSPRKKQSEDGDTPDDGPSQQAKPSRDDSEEGP